MILLALILGMRAYLLTIISCGRVRRAAHATS